MKLRKLIYSEVALFKRKAIKRSIREKYGKEVADKVAKKMSKSLAKLKVFPELGTSIKDRYHLDCDYYMFFVEQNYFIYRITEDTIMILEVFNEKEDFVYHLFGIITTSQESIDYWGEE